MKPFFKALFFIVITTLAGLCSVQAEGDFFDFLKDIDFDALAREMGIENQVSETPAPQAKKDSEQGTDAKKETVFGMTKDVKSLFTEPLVASTPEREETLSLPLPKQNAFNAVMGQFARDLQELSIKINALPNSDTKDEFLKLPFNKKIAEIIAMYEVLKEVDDKHESKYLNIFYLNIEANNNLRKKIFDAQETVKKHNDAIIVKRKAVGEKLAKYAKKPELKIPEFASSLAARKREHMEEGTKIPTLAKQKKALLDPVLVKNLDAFKKTLVQNVFPISDELSKMKDSPEFKAEVEKKKQEIEQKIQEAAQRTSSERWVPRWRRRGRYGQALPRHYHDGRPSPRWTSGPPSESRPSFAQSSPSRPDVTSKTDTKPADSTFIGTEAEAGKGTSSKEPTLYSAGPGLSEIERDAKKRVENIYHEITETMEKLAEAPDQQTQQAFKDLAQKIENKKH
ncbi:MAG: hypothetical protein V1855_01130, partial [bacterium]